MRPKEENYESDGCSKAVEMVRVVSLSVQTLYESSIAFGIRKALQAEQGKTDMENYIAKLEEEKVTVVILGKVNVLMIVLSRVV